MSRVSGSKKFERAPARPIRKFDDDEAERLHHEDRQLHLASTPEGTEPSPRVRRLSWMLFGGVTALSLILMLGILSATWGWAIAVFGSIAVIAGYFIMFWPDYAAWALRNNDKREADRKVEAGVPPERPGHPDQPVIPPPPGPRAR